MMVYLVSDVRILHSRRRKFQKLRIFNREKYFLNYVLCLEKRKSTEKRQIWHLCWSNFKFFIGGNFHFCEERKFLFNWRMFKSHMLFQKFFMQNVKFLCLFSASVSTRLFPRSNFCLRNFSSSWICSCLILSCCCRSKISSYFWRIV